MNTLQEVLAKHRNDLSGCCICPERTEWKDWPAHVEQMIRARLVVMTAREFAEHLSEYGQHAVERERRREFTKAEVKR